MKKVSVVIPNYNGMRFVKTCLDSLMNQTLDSYEVLFVDNGSVDGSREWVEQEYPQVRVIALKENTGFCYAVNLGVEESQGEYVVLLNNDTKVEPDFLEELYLGMERRPKAFSGASKMLQFHAPHCMDDGGDFYSALGWAFALGKGKPEEKYQSERKIFSACAGAAIYRKSWMEELGGLDEKHFAYLEDMDLGYRARIAGYENWYFPKARVYHVGSGTSGSTHNPFKVRYSARNNIYLIYKNMPMVQLLLNVPLLLFGFGVKYLFFVKAGFSKEYLQGIRQGFSICDRENKVKFKWSRMKNYIIIQMELWINVIRRFI